MLVVVRRAQSRAYLVTGRSVQRLAISYTLFSAITQTPVLYRSGFVMNRVW